MRITEIIWKSVFVEKINQKHNVTIDEAEYILEHSPIVRKIEKGKKENEDVYAFYGQIRSGRFLIVFAIIKEQHVALPISARDMEKFERNYFEKQKQ